MSKLPHAPSDDSPKAARIAVFMSKNAPELARVWKAASDKFFDAVQGKGGLGGFESHGEMVEAVGRTECVAAAMISVASIVPFDAENAVGVVHGVLDSIVVQECSDPATSGRTIH